MKKFIYSSTLTHRQIKDDFIIWSNQFSIEPVDTIEVENMETGERLVTTKYQYLIELWKAINKEPVVGDLMLSDIKDLVKPWGVTFTADKLWMDNSGSMSPLK